jgi:ATP adenylyltransferase
MDHLWAPWRREFIDAPKEEGCIFCRYPAETGREADRKNLVLGRSPKSFAILNKYPYNNGHLMVVPRRHTGDYAGLGREELYDLQQLLQTALKIVNDAYQPAGANLGMNVGRDAGAGIDGHLHWHVVPRWRGDTNFMPIIGDTKVMIETLEQTWDALQPRFEAALAGR